MDICTIILEEIHSALKKDLKKEYKNGDTPNLCIPFGKWKDKQIQHALTGYAAGCRLQDAVVLCDTTIFGNGTKGFLFSTEGVYSNDFNCFRKKSPLALPVKYADLAKAHADSNDSELQLTYKDGHTETVYTGIYTGFIVTILQQILLRTQQDGASANAEKPAAAKASAGKEPVSEKTASKKPAAQEIASSPETPDNIRKNLQKILIADDSSFSRITLKNMLHQAGYEVCGEAANGKEAVALFKEQMPGLTILDVDMPETDGIEALKQIKEYSSFSYVIMLDESHSQEVYDRCASAYANRILYKPVREADLIRAVRDLLEPGWDWNING
ncbi:MAG: response regulator [Eubacteriales bacterium]|nr:response regulator [Eubacteriales bacterium]